MFKSLQEKKRLSLRVEMCSKQRGSSVLYNSNKSSESKTSCYANSITAHGPSSASLSASPEVKGDQASKLCIIFLPLNPWAEFLNHSCVLRKVQAPGPPCKPINVTPQLPTRGCFRDADSPRPLPR